MIIPFFLLSVNAIRLFSSIIHRKNRPYTEAVFMYNENQVQHHAAFFFMGKKIASKEHTSSRPG